MRYYIYKCDNAEDFVYLGIDKGAEAEKIFGLVRTLTGKPFALIAFEAESWNADFSPWEAPPVFGDEGFAGNGKSTLDALEKEVMPEAEAGYTVRRRYIAGYSLAGLFGLWAFYESGRFDGAASCSGSLWFPNWTEYARAHKAHKKSAVYLSLGDKEERTKNKVMSRVGDCTRLQERLLSEDENVSAHVLERNSGGHFTEPDMRTARGIGWLLNNSLLCGEPPRV